MSIEWNAKDFLERHAVAVEPGTRSISLERTARVALGIEPVCSAFGLGLAVTRAQNPLRRAGTPTVIEFDPAHPFKTSYRISAMPLPPAS